MMQQVANYTNQAMAAQNMIMMHPGQPPTQPYFLTQRDAPPSHQQEAFGEHHFAGYDRNALSDRPLFPYSNRASAGGHQQPVFQPPGLDPIQQRKALIMAKMAEERAMRQQLVAEGRVDEFRFADLAQARSEEQNLLQSRQNQLQQDGPAATSTGYSHGGTTNVANMMMCLGQQETTNSSQQLSPGTSVRGSYQPGPEQLHFQQHMSSPSMDTFVHHANQPSTSLNQMYIMQDSSQQALSPPQNPPAMMPQSSNFAVMSDEKRAMVERMLQNRRQGTTSGNTFNLQQQTQSHQAQPLPQQTQLYQNSQEYQLPSLQEEFSWQLGQQRTGSGVVLGQQFPQEREDQDEEDAEDDMDFGNPEAIYAAGPEAASSQELAQQEADHLEQDQVYGSEGGSPEYKQAIDSMKQRIRDQLAHPDIYAANPSQHNQELLKQLAAYDQQIMSMRNQDACTEADDGGIGSSSRILRKNQSASLRQLTHLQQQQQRQAQAAGTTDGELDALQMDEFADPSMLYSNDQIDHQRRHSTHDRESRLLRTAKTELKVTCPIDQSGQYERPGKKPPMPAKHSQQPPKPRKPPVAVSNNAQFLKPTVSSEIRKQVGEPSREKSLEFVKQADERFQEQCTFQPKINPGKQQDAADGQRSREERWRRLTEPKAEAQRLRDQAKAQQEIEEIQKNCPFRPQLQTHRRSNSARRRLGPAETLNNRSGIPGTAHRSLNSSNSALDLSRASNPRFFIPIQDRLMHEADLKREKREKMKREQDMLLMQECSFQPNLITNGTSGSRKSNLNTSTGGMINKNKLNHIAPIHERVNQIQKEKNERLQKLRVKAEEEQRENKFRPQINSKSEKIALIKQVQEVKTPGVVDRLYNDAASRIERNMKSQMSIRSMQNQSMQANDPYTFHPAISDTSKILADQNDMYQGDYKDFQTRQTEFINRQREKREALKNQYSEEAVHKFKPQINFVSEVICQADPSREQETQDDKINRLYNKDLLKKQVQKELISQEVYKELTFKPKINNISARIAPDTSIIERTQNCDGVKRKEQLRQEYQRQQDEQCTFKPKTNLAGKKEYAEKSSEYAPQNTKQFSENLKAQQKAKMARIAQERRNREFAEEKDCTFAPKVNKNAPTAPAEDVEIKGLGRVLELRELQKKKEAEMLLRQAEVFGLNHKFAVNADQCDLKDPKPSQIFPLGQHDNSARPHITVPEPFNLLTEERGEAYDKKFQLMKEQQRMREDTYCTFQPELNSHSRMLTTQPLAQETDTIEAQDGGDDEADMIASGSQMDFSNGIAMSAERGAPFSALVSNKGGREGTELSPTGTDQYQWFNQM